MREVSKKYNLILISILLIITLSTLILAETTNPKVKSGYCEGNYIIDCSGGISCSTYEIDDNGSPIGCSDNAPSFCEEVPECRDYQDPYCDRYAYTCEGAKRCELQMCIDRTYQECSASFETCSFFDELSCKSKESLGCSWNKEGSCPIDYNKIYSYCSGEYKTTEISGTCMGTYTSCPGDGQSFLSPVIEDQVSMPENGECEIRSCFGTTEEYCKASGPVGSCIWHETTETVTKSCSGLSKTDCLNNDGCIANYECVEQKLKECETCIEDSDCAVGLKCKMPLRSTTKKCVPYGECATYLNIGGFSKTICSKPLETTTCLNGEIYVCSHLTMQLGSQDWNKIKTCDSGECLANECKPVPAEPNPILKWINPLTHAEIATSINTPKQIKVNDLPFNTILLVEDPDESKDNTFRIKEGTNTIVETKGFYNSNDNTYLYGLEITKAILDGLEPNENDIYELYYNIYEKTSPIFYLQASGLDHCSNSIQDYDEEDIDCGGLDCSICCGNGICGNTENYTVCPADCPQPLIKEAKWGVSSPLKLDSDVLVKGVEIEMQLYNADNPQTTTFTLKEDDTGLLQSDDLVFKDIKGVASLTNPNNAIYIWNATLRDIEKVKDDDSDNIYEFIFEAEGIKSQILEVQLTDELPTCSDNKTNGYEEGLDCGGDCPNECTCQQPSGDPIATCAHYSKEDCNIDDICGVLKGDTSGLQCSWDAEEGVCGERLFISVDGINIGNCFYTEDSSEDNCDDGFLSYSVNANWEWDPDNSKGIKPEGTGWIQDNVTGNWHYDPEGASSECKYEEKTIACPAQIQLSFFTWKNILAASIILLIFYIIINMRKQNKIKNKKRQEKTIKKIKKNINKKKTEKKSNSKKKSTKTKK